MCACMCVGDLLRYILRWLFCCCAVFVLRMFVYALCAIFRQRARFSMRNFYDFNKSTMIIEYLSIAPYSPWVWPPKSNVVKRILPMDSSSDAREQRKDTWATEWSGVDEFYTYLDAVLAHAAPAYHLWAYAIMWSYQHYPSQGTIVCRTFSIDLCMKSVDFMINKYCVYIYVLMKTLSVFWSMLMLRSNCASATT